MKMVKTKLALGAAVAALALSAGAANAAVNFVGFTGGAHNPAPGGNVVVSFDGPNAAGYSFTGGSIESPPADPGEYAVPFGDTTKFAVVKPGQEGVFSTSNELTTFSVYIGSLDLYNSIAFYVGGILINGFGEGPGYSSLSGKFGALANQSATDPVANGRFYFQADAGTYFDEVRFTSSTKSIEFDTITAGVPEPGTWALMIAGFGMLGSALRRRRTVVGAVA